ncbi:hypothetical protein D3C87_2138160 [compost metagenome]
MHPGHDTNAMGCAVGLLDDVINLFRRFDDRLENYPHRYLRGLVEVPGNDLRMFVDLPERLLAI